MTDPVAVGGGQGLTHSLFKVVLTLVCCVDGSKPDADGEFR